MSESSIEIQTSPEPSIIITKKPFKGPEEVEVTTPSNKMDMDQDIKVINQKERNASPEEGHKWRIPELPPVSKVDIYQSQYKNWFMEAKQQEWKLLPSIWIGTMNSLIKEFLVTRKDRGPSEGLDTHVLQRKSLKAWLKSQSALSEDQKKKLAQEKDNSPVESPQASTSAKKGKASSKEQSEGQEKGKVQVEQILPTELKNSKERKDSHGKCTQYCKNCD
ncbi:hypothetical protein O181_067300 [Austropuccinia psidii MF-1]|uniref:Uncharacterized protein n=1 Tax=Austropuccinia psidii MF-1 TaxID=1389203 RepID=A0A9Q3EYP8_9BASI|nr:hypothetical protein [Austropuccinia psidii MF-1]